MALDKTRWRMEQAIRLTMSQPGLIDAEIAEFIGLTPAGYATMKGRPEFKALQNQIMSGVLSTFDVALADDYKAMRDMQRMAVPLALQKLLSHVNSKDEKVSLRACESVLNRDGRFAEVSRIGAPTEDQGGVAKSHDMDTAKELLAVMPVQEPKKESIQ